MIFRAKDSSGGRWWRLKDTPLGAGGVLASSFAIGPATALACSVPLAGSLGLAWLVQLSAR